VQAEELRTPRRPLRRAVLIAFAPLCLVLLVATTSQLMLARAVHEDLQRLFEELREVNLARALVDELRGVQQWVVTAPNATRSNQPLVIADVQRHHDAASSTIARFATVDDPSRREHDAGEDALLQRIDATLRASADKLAAEAPLQEMAPAVDQALHHAQVLIQAVEDETREIGDDLDHRTANMAQFLVLLGAVSVGTLGLLAWLLLQRVLRPVRELRAAAIRLGRGEIDAAVPVHHADELGDLALTFRAMAGKLLQSRAELEQRVDERSREVLRTAQLAQLGTLAAGIAHEINNPLASIVAGADGLLRELDRSGRSDEGMREYLQILRKEGLRARDITVRLLRFARQDKPRREPVRLPDEAREVAAMFGHQLADAGVTLRLLGVDDAPAILGDPAEWRQVLFNLLRNALDASPRGGVITVAFGRDHDDALLVVRDQGTGIPPELVDRIFEPFFTTKEPGRGTGLGLAIVHRIVTAHGGRIGVQNGEQGAEFTIHVPMLRAAG